MFVNRNSSRTSLVLHFSFYNSPLKLPPATLRHSLSHSQLTHSLSLPLAAQPHSLSLPLVSHSLSLLLAGCCSLSQLFARCRSPASPPPFAASPILHSESLPMLHLDPVCISLFLLSHSLMLCSGKPHLWIRTNPVRGSAHTRSLHYVASVFVIIV